MKVKSFNESSFFPHSEMLENGGRDRRTSLISCVQYEILISSSLERCFLIAPIRAIAISRSIISVFLFEPVRQIDKPFAIVLISLTLSLCKCSLRLKISSCPLKKCAFNVYFLTVFFPLFVAYQRKQFLQCPAIPLHVEKVYIEPSHYPRPYYYHVQYYYHHEKKLLKTGYISGV